MAYSRSLIDNPSRESHLDLAPFKNHELRGF